MLLNKSIGDSPGGCIVYPELCLKYTSSDSYIYLPHFKSLAIILLLSSLLVCIKVLQVLKFTKEELSKVSLYKILEVIYPPDTSTIPLVICSNSVGSLVLPILTLPSELVFK